MSTRVTKGLRAVAATVSRIVLVTGLAFLAAPAVSATVIIESTFRSSTTGTSQIHVGDTIAFEQWITISEGLNITGVAPFLTGDRAGAIAHPPPACPGGGLPCYQNGVAGIVSGWDESDVLGPRAANYGVEYVHGTRDPFYLDGRTHENLGLGNPVAIPIWAFFPYGDDDRYEGNGVRSLMGTVTITANQGGSFEAGALLVETIASVLSFNPDNTSLADELIELPVTVYGSNYTVTAPEPGTAVLMAAGLAGLGAIARRRER